MTTKERAEKCWYEGVGGCDAPHIINAIESAIVATLADRDQEWRDVFRSVIENSVWPDLDRAAANRILAEFERRAKEGV